MQIQHTFTLTMVMDVDKYNNILNMIMKKHRNKLEKTDDGYIDTTLSKSGIDVKFSDEQYRKLIIIWIRFITDMNYSGRDSHRIVHKLDQIIRNYFENVYCLNDFSFAQALYTMDIDVGSKSNVQSYIKVLQRINKVKNFTAVSSYGHIGENDGVYFDGNSNYISLILYDLQNQFMNTNNIDETNIDTAKEICNSFEGILKSEVALMKPKAIREYTAETETSDQIVNLLDKSKAVVLDVFFRIIPFGGFYKMAKTKALIEQNVHNKRMKDMMDNLVNEIPRKRTIWDAQRELNCRWMDDVMMEFNRIEVSPVTISKRHDEKSLPNLYRYILDDIDGFSIATS